MSQTSLKKRKKKSKAKTTQTGMKRNINWSEKLIE